MFVEIIFSGLPIDRDDLEDALTAEFALDGEVTGAGTGEHGGNLDLEIAESADRTAALERLQKVFVELGIENHVRPIVRD
ncbi:hypothetical protein ABT008_26670 [Micromonospora sp. NPDC002389]|uniref:hypothetical protein n=1 Tax=Micromonospora sp. NPDC002389 TaxID=3154272 RepID=UPI0033336D4D